MCDPSDYYCFAPSEADLGLLKYYSSNASIPGALFQPTPRPSGQHPMRDSRAQGPMALQHAFSTDTHLPYAFPELQAMRGAPPLEGSEVNKWNVFLLPDGYFQEAMARAAPNAQGFGGQGQKERCGCGKTSSARKW